MTVASRPARAMLDGAAVLACVLVYRWPTIERAFTAALAAAEDRAGRSPARWLSGVTSRALPSPVVATAISRVPPAAVRPPGGRVPGEAIATIPPPVAAGPSLITEALSSETPTAAIDPAADALATAAYARLAVGDRRAAVRLFDAALLLGDPRAPAWRSQRDALTRRWSGSAYSVLRAGGDPALAVSPVLGGGQSGAGIAFTPDPLASRPFAITARGSIAHGDGGRSAFAAVGVQWHPFTGVTIAGERLIAVGRAAPNDWTVRVAAGTDRTIGRWRATAYGEAGIVGRTTYGAIQGRTAAVFHLAHVEIDPGAGLWSSIQRSGAATVDRVDVGPGVVARAGPFAAEVDYRFRVAGNAAPGSGPVLTLSAAF
jgi:hypothetical protein